MRDHLMRNWMVLIALIAVTVALATQDGRIAAAGLLVLAWAKARAILGGFLHLDQAPRMVGSYCR